MTETAKLGRATLRELDLTTHGSKIKEDNGETMAGRSDLPTSCHPMALFLDKAS